jgi:hypothetical protein
VRVFEKNNIYLRRETIFKKLEKDETNRQVQFRESAEPPKGGKYKIKIKPATVEQHAAINKVSN